jgi:hypothetical protein
MPPLGTYDGIRRYTALATNFCNNYLINIWFRVFSGLLKYNAVSPEKVDFNPPKA